MFKLFLNEQKTQFKVHIDSETQTQECRECSLWLVDITTSVLITRRQYIWQWLGNPDILGPCVYFWTIFFLNSVDGQAHRWHTFALFHCYTFWVCSKETGWVGIHSGRRLIESEVHPSCRSAGLPPTWLGYDKLSTSIRTRSLNTSHRNSDGSELVSSKKIGIPKPVEWCFLYSEEMGFTF